MKKILYILLLISIIFSGCSAVEQKNYLGNYETSGVFVEMKNDKTLKILMIDLIKENNGFATFLEVPIINDNPLSLGNEENTNRNLKVLPLYSMTGLGQEEYFVIKNEGIQMARVEDNMLILYLTYKVKPMLEEEYLFFEKEIFLEYDVELNTFSLINSKD